jgi:hypothetical protein
MKLKPPSLQTVLDWIFTLSAYLFPFVLILLVWFRNDLWINITVTNVIVLAAVMIFDKIENLPKK